MAYPNDCADVLGIFASFSQDLVDALPDVQTWNDRLNRFKAWRAEIPVVFAGTEIEHDLLAGWMLEMETERWEIEILMAFQDRAHEAR